MNACGSLKEVYMLSKRLLAGARAGSFHKTSVPAGAGAWRVAPSGAFFGLCFRTESHRNELQSTPARRSEKRSTGVEGELTKGLCAGPSCSAPAGRQVLSSAEEMDLTSGRDVRCDQALVAWFDLTPMVSQCAGRPVAAQCRSHKPQHN